MARLEAPEVEPDPYERRLLHVFTRMKGEKPYGGEAVIQDAWLEGHHPETEIVVLFTWFDRPGCRFIFRMPVWPCSVPTRSRDSNPEAAAADVSICVLEWHSNLRSMPWTPGITVEPRTAQPGAIPRRPTLS